MDQRQTKIVEGAGLEESRLNQDFIEFLQKWGTPVLLVVCVLAAGYSGWVWWQRLQVRAFEEAFAQYTAAQVSGSPDGLLRVAREHASQGSVEALATISAADIYLNSALLWMAPGGDPAKPEDRLTPEQRTENFKRARDLYQQVVDKSAGSETVSLHALDARFGVAAAAASLGEIEAAQTVLKELKPLALKAGYAGLAATADRLLTTLGDVDSAPPLYTEEQVAASARPAPEEPAPTPLLTDDSPVGPVLPEAQEPAPTEPPAAPER